MAIDPGIKYLTPINIDTRVKILSLSQSED